MKTYDTDKMGELQHCNLDDANYMLRTGRATKEQAAEYVKMWNTPGMRFTVARLEDRLIVQQGIEMIAPEIRISDN